MEFQLKDGSGGREWTASARSSCHNVLGSYLTQLSMQLEAGERSELGRRKDLLRKPMAAVCYRSTLAVSGKACRA